MSDPARPLPDFDDADAETAALKAAVAQSDADPAWLRIKDIRDWLLKLAAGQFETPPPVARDP